MKSFFTFLSAFIFISAAQAQISARLLKEMDVSATHISFVYGGDVWLMPKNGGQAVQVTHSQGEESYPKFSPDGSQIAYTAAYNGNEDVFVIPALGGLPTRVTYASFGDRLVDWHPDGEHLLFASRREAGVPRVNQLFKVPKSGGMPERLVVPYAELASYSPDGNKLVYTTKITSEFPFKRYRGGLTSELIIFDLNNQKAENITNSEAIDGHPAWAGENIYFLSDAGELMRLNLWVYDTTTKQERQITRFSDFDISHLSAGPTDLVFEAGGKLYLMPLASEEIQEIQVNVVSDLAAEIPKTTDVSKNIQNMTASPGGKRISFEARGEIFNVPVKEGYSMNHTKSSGAFDHSPAWSPDGNHLAWWSDGSGEYEIYLQDTRKEKAPRKLTSRNGGFGYKLHWSPDSKHIAFVDEKSDINIINVSSGNIRKADNYNWNLPHGAGFSYPVSWSPDSKWIAYTTGQENFNDAIFLYNLDQQKTHRVTSGYYSDTSPVFSSDGKYLYFLTDRDFDAVYSGLDDGTWIYPNNTQLAAIGLTKDAPPLLPAKNDEVEAPEKEESKPADKGRKDQKEEAVVSVRVDPENMESRIVILPPKAGNLGNLMSVGGKIVYLRYPLAGDEAGTTSLRYYDAESREEKMILDKVSGAVPTAGQKLILVSSAGKYGIVKPEPEQKLAEPIPTDGLVMQLSPREEWRQIFNDTWRRYRDFFYDKNMHGVDWEQLKERYGALIDDARTRWDIGNIQRDLIAELSAGHTYAGGGDTENVNRIPTGYLGIDWELSNGKYRIKRIVKPAAWDTEVRSPLDIPGSGVKEGDYILAVNGQQLNPAKDPYAAFAELSGKTISLSVSSSGSTADAKSHVIKCLTLGEESNLRYLEWIENNRKMVEELSDGQLGYVYMSNTSARGQIELVRMFYGQLGKKGFVIDERFNGGGQLADRFLELLKRPVIYNLYWRHGKNHQYPVKTNTGPQAMLINGWAGSGGDALPWAFRELDAGPIIGERTVGILVGPATGHMLIDGGYISVPGARLYYNDGSWFQEGVGVRPDYEVWDDPDLLIQGRDPQMEKAVELVMEAVKKNPPKKTPPPPMQDRTAKGLKKEL